ncbi:MAG: protein-disulfide reductase DsbD family protein [Vicinamibacteria bacterium]
MKALPYPSRHWLAALGVSAIGWLALAPAAFAQGSAAPSASAQSKHVRVTLVPEHEGVRPGQPLTVGLRIEHEAEWHTYWRNVGDSGLKTRIAWTLPEGFSAGEIQWPRPEKVFVAPLMSYGYSGETWLLSELSVPAKLDVASVSLRAKVDWLECKEACLPGKATLELTLPVKVDAKPSAAHAAAFASARAALPRPAGFAASAAFSDKALSLEVRRAGALPREAYFFPYAAELIDHAAPQALAAVAGGFRLEIPRPANGKAADVIAGVLELDGVALEVSAALAATAGGPGGGEPRSAAGVAATGQPAPPPPVPAPSAPMGGSAGSLPVALVFAFIGGLILNLMPCVLPVLSLKVMGFVRDGAEYGALRHGLAFTAGVVVFFWALAGALLALKAGGEQIGWGFQLQSPLFVVFLAALFLLLSLNLFGLFEVGESLTAVGNLEPRTKGLAGSFWSGALATIVATPCTAPFMGSALGFAMSQPAWVAFSVFSALGLGMASPYLVLAASPRLLRMVPKPGAWMEGFKQAMGFVLLGTVVFLLWLFGRQVGVNGMTILLGALLLLGMAAWLYGRVRRGAPRLRLAGYAAAFALAAGGLALGFAYAPASAEERHAGGDGVWEEFSPERVALLRRAGTPVFVDFTADWCLTCQVNLKLALERPEVLQRFRDKGVVMMKADWTRSDERITRALAEHGRQGVPLYVLYGRDGAPRLLPEVLRPGIVLQALDELG